MELQSSHVSLYGLDLLGSKKKMSKIKVIHWERKGKREESFSNMDESKSLIFNMADTCGDYSACLNNRSLLNIIYAKLLIFPAACFWRQTS